LTLGPAPIDAGFIFVRAGSGREVQAVAESVIATEFATVLGDRNGPLVSTSEHVLAALRGMGVDNATIEIDGPEVPIMDGSAEAFVAAIDHAGVRSLDAPRRFLKVLKPVRVTQGRSVAEILPNSRGLRLEIDIEFDHPLIGRQRCALDVSPANFRRELARARTFGFMCDVAKLWNQGYALGASFENTLVVSETRVLNADGVRYPDEFVRHKALDAVGDLALAGLPLLATYRSVRGGHTLNHAILSALMADPTAWAVVEATAPVVAPPRRVRGHAEVATPAPAYAPDVS
jgi:UDP-3-O-[3-hydroxymyristoyl] N-acetylglucosamine deacetylase